MANTTRTNIQRKRKKMRRKRRVRFFRLLVVVVVMGLIVAGAVFVGYSLFQWGGHIIADYQAMYTGYNERMERQRGTIDPRFDGYTNVLILGLDDGAGSDNSGLQAADTIILASLENDTGRVRFITIPRDTWVGQAKISSLYTNGGAPLMVRQVSALLGVSVHQYVALDMGTFADLIDLLGGIDVYVEADMDYDDPEAELAIHFKKGYQHLNGQDAQKYLRYRGTELKDVGRAQRQAKFIKALYNKILQFETIPKLPAIADIFKNKIVTSAELFDSAHLANVLRKLAGDTPQAVMLPGSPAADDDTIWIPDNGAIAAKMHELFPVNELTDGQ